jgi:hypothetical protein
VGKNFVKFHLIWRHFIGKLIILNAYLNYDSLTITIMDHSEYYNFTYTLDYVGSVYELLILDNGSYTGLIGQILIWAMFLL